MAHLLANEVISKIAQEGFTFDEERVLTAEEKESHRTQQALYDYMWTRENEKEI